MVAGKAIERFLSASRRRRLETKYPTSPMRRPSHAATETGSIATAEARN
jgi:hypothetical protein